MSPVRTCWVQMCTLLSTDMHSICLFNLCWKQMCAMLSKETCYVACENLLEADVHTLVYRHAFHLPV